MQLIISEPGTRKAYAKKLEQATFLGKRIGEEINLDSVELKGFKGVITGGTDKEGFPMDASIEGTGRKRILKTVKDKKKLKEKKTIRVRVIKKKITVRGNTVADDINQLNIKLTTKGPQDLEMILGKKTEGEEAVAEGNKK